MTTREVVLDGGSPWGFRLHGGADVNQPLRISRVNPGSKAALRGIREGDFITSINNQSTKDISNAEAHALLRNSGDILKLGLNEDGGGSPKRRQYKTVHQETHSETVRKSSITSYTVTSSKTIETSNEDQTSKVNGNTNKLNGDPPNPPAIHQRSPLSSSSSTSTYTSLTSPSGIDMADNARSRRKRGRNRKKGKQPPNTTVIVEESCDDSPDDKKDYRVESPRVKSPEAKKPVKSRSLDDDDVVKIQELSEVSESEDKSECKAIVSEAESDVEWEVTAAMEDPLVQTGTLSTLSLNLDHCTTEQVSLISPEEELTLRNFLEGLNLVNSPEDAFRQVREISTMDSVKTRRARKRAAIEQYFSPMVHNPRFLDVISEETSDLSDREQSFTHHLKQGTPEPDVPPRPPKPKRVVQNPTILVGTRMMDVPGVTHEISTSSVPQSTAEVVFLDESSGSTTPDPKSDDEEKDVLSSTHSSVPDLHESESVEEKKQVRIVVKKNDVLATECQSVEQDKRWNTESELTPPPTLDDDGLKLDGAECRTCITVEKRDISAQDKFRDNVLEVVPPSKPEVNKERIVPVEIEKGLSLKCDNKSGLLFLNSKSSTTKENVEVKDSLQENVETAKDPVKDKVNTGVETETMSSQINFSKICFSHTGPNSSTSSGTTTERIVPVTIENQDKNAQNEIDIRTSDKIEETKREKNPEKEVSVSEVPMSSFSNAPRSLGSERIIPIAIENRDKSTHNEIRISTPDKIEETKEEKNPEIAKTLSISEVPTSFSSDTSRNLGSERIIPVALENQDEPTRSSPLNKVEATNSEISTKIEKQVTSSVFEIPTRFSSKTAKSPGCETIIPIAIENGNKDKGTFKEVDGAKVRLINIEVQKESKPDIKNDPLNNEKTIFLELEGEKHAQSKITNSEIDNSFSTSNKIEENRASKIEEQLIFSSSEVPLSCKSLSSNTSISERIIPVAVENGDKFSKGKTTFKKPEGAKVRLINIEVEKGSNPEIEKDSFNKERTIFVELEEQHSQNKTNNSKNKIEETKATKIEKQLISPISEVPPKLGFSSNTTISERIIPVRIENGNHFTKDKGTPKEVEETNVRLINVEVEKDVKPEVKIDSNNKERTIFVEFEKHDQHETKISDAKTLEKTKSEVEQEDKSTKSEEVLTRLETSERIVPVKLEEKYQSQISLSQSSKKEFSEYRDLTCSKNVGFGVDKSNAQHFPKENIIEVKAEKEWKLNKTSTNTCERKEEETLGVSQERIIDVKLESRSVTDVPKPNKPPKNIKITKEVRIPVEIKTEHKSSSDSKKSKDSKEHIIHVKVEEPVKSERSKDTLKNVETVKIQNVMASPKIVKLDDMKQPIVLTPGSPLYSKLNLEPEWKQISRSSENKSETIRNIEIIKSEDIVRTKEDYSKSFSSKGEEGSGFLNLKSEDQVKNKCSSNDKNKEKDENLQTSSNLDQSPEQDSNSNKEVTVGEHSRIASILDQESTIPSIPKIKPTDEIKTLKRSEPKESPSKEVESFCNLRPKSLFYSNVLSPPAPSPSPSLSSGSSSRATSLCTVKTSSTADLTSIKDEEPPFKPESPLTLRELCVNFLVTQPFGRDILQELADVSSSIEHLTQNLLTQTSNISSFKSDTVKIPAMWVGLPTEDDPRLLVCLSPTQKVELDKSRKVCDEAAKLLDLHEKFIYRTTYHDAVERQVKNEVEITAIKPDVNRLLAIIRDAQEPKIGKFSTLPRNMDSARLKAKDLSEWLQLARSKSDENNQFGNAQRRNSLPEFYKQQMEYLREKEREIQRELEVLEEEKRQLDMARKFRPEDYHISKRGDFAETRKPRPVSMPVATEFFRQQMYEEYMDKIAAREERKQHKVIKVSKIEATPVMKTAAGIEDEFMNKVKQKQKLGKLNKEDNTDDESDAKVPKHLQEFMDIAKIDDDGVWSPGQKQDRTEGPPKSQTKETNNEPISPVWTPKSATSSPTVERKEFRPVKFESPVLSRRSFRNEDVESEPPWKSPESSSDVGTVLSSTLEKRLTTSHSSPASGFHDFPATRLPRAQNPTITLLQKAREGQLPKGASYIEQDQSSRRTQNEKPGFVGPGEILYKIKNEYTSESDSEKPRKMADLGPRKFEGIGPTTREGMPLILRSEVKDANQSKWYKRMYDTIHKQRPHRDEFVTVRYKQKRGQYPYNSGYLSEPEPGAYDSDFTDYKYATLDRRRRERDNEMSSTMPRNVPDKVGSSVIKHGHDPYKNQPGRIENYIPGHSSISDKEAKEWWDEVMDIFDGHLEQQKRVPQTKSFINQALKESGYESDSTLVFRRRDDTAQLLSPTEQKEAYKTIQKGGDIPLYGLRKPAPERPKEPEPPLPPPKGHHDVRHLQQESPRKYVENEVTIHYKTPVRQEIKEYLSEDELAYRQAEAMKKIYQEERRRKYLQVSKSLQELQDMNNRRHTDNFIPSQKSPIPLNRYDDFEDLAPPVKPRPRSPEPRLMARALYNFVGQTARELTFRKGDIIYVRRQVDKNWYEGELNAMVGLFPVNYVEIVTYDTAKPTPRKSHEGQARAKYNFVAQTHLELSLAKGELVIITRRVDDNWFEGKIGGRKGIFPVSYVDILIDPNDPPSPSGKPVAAPAAHSLLLNGSAGGKESMGSHSYTPNLSSNQLTSSYHAKPAQVTGSYGSLNRGPKNPVNQALHIETQAEPIPYRALYKYLPQNDDELELLEGDTVYVLEKCDDGWYVGSSDRTGAFGTFPGNYVEKI